ncbi:MAG: HD domain-containing protein [Acidimicrobiales bacterium]
MERLRLVELTAAVSLATDLGTGQPLEHALRTAALSVWAAEELGWSPPQRVVVLYTSLLRFLGCTADASETALLAGGDEIGFNAAMAPMVMADDREALPHLIRHLGDGLPAGRRAGRVAAALRDPGGKRRSLSAHCEAGARLATRIGLPPEVTHGLAHAYERWDGKGLPDGLAGDEVPEAIRVAVVARDFELWRQRGGLDDALAVLARRRGRAYDPVVVDVFAANARRWAEELDGIDAWDAVVTAEGSSPAVVSGDDLDRVLVAFADFTDLKSFWFRGHSRSVAELAASAASSSGLDAHDVAAVRRAGLVHDIGTVGVPAGIWDRAGPLSSESWERVRLHSYWAERILCRCDGLAGLAVDVSAHHERVDGSGYHRAARDLRLSAQLLAAADVYRALCEDRPHREALTPVSAAAVLAEHANRGAFARTAVDAVLSAAGQTPPSANVARPGGLTEREIDVLRLISRGRSNKEVARHLGISAKTVGSHVEHIYVKAGVRTRAGVTLFAMEHDLVRG